MSINIIVAGLVERYVVEASTGKEENEIVPSYN